MAVASAGPHKKWNTNIDKFCAKATFLKTAEAGWDCCRPIATFLAIIYSVDVRILMHRPSVAWWTDQNSLRPYKGTQYESSSRPLLTCPNNLL